MADLTRLGHRSRGSMIFDMSDRIWLSYVCLHLCCHIYLIWRDAFALTMTVRGLLEALIFSKSKRVSCQLMHSLFEVVEMWEWSNHKRSGSFQKDREQRGWQCIGQSRVVSCQPVFVVASTEVRSTFKKMISEPCRIIEIWSNSSI